MPTPPTTHSSSKLGGRLSRELRSLTAVWRPRLTFWTGLANLLPDFALASVRAAFYRKAGCDIAPGVAMLGRVRLIGSGPIAPRLHIAEGATIAPGVVFDLDAEITIGRNVSLSPNATLYTATHSLGFGSRRMSPVVMPKPVVVEDGAWIGMNALILPGVTIGQGSVVSAGSIVTKTVEANTLVSGNPATVQNKLPFGER